MSDPEVDDHSRTRYFDQRIGQAIDGCDVQLTMQRHNVDGGKVADANAELGQHNRPFPPKVAGGRAPGGRSADQSYFR